MLRHHAQSRPLGSDIVTPCGRGVTVGSGRYAVGTTATFTIVSTPDGRTRVRVTHGGWPHDEGNFIKCNTIWGALMDHLREYVESGVSDPAFS